jgi:Tetratricopeptide repeat
MKVIVAFFITLFSALGIYSDKYDQAQAAYRNGDFAQAAVLLEPLSKQGRDDASILLAYVYVQQGKLEASEALFKTQYDRKSGGADIPYGLALIYRARSNFKLARKFVLEARQLDPNRVDIKEFLDRLPVPLEAQVRPALVRPTETVQPWSASKGYLRGPDGQPFVVKGVNLGVALPGKFPAEFPLEKKMYSDWLDLIAAMNANTVRVYTILPPVFYEALRDHNMRNPLEPLYLIHGVWTELPEEEGLTDYRGEFQKRFLEESFKVVDLLHGRADLPVRPGHANGNYNADVSQWLIGYIIGREWEPFSVKAYDKMALTKPYPKRFRGQYLEMPKGTPFEAWLAEIMDAVTSFEMRRYNAQRPIAFTNWPTTDPINHISESTNLEEAKLQIARGEYAVLPKPDQVTYNDDDVALDPTHLKATNAFAAGTFASYHAYPYYPDFLRNDPAYQNATGPHGQSVYYAYLKNLKRHHGDQAVLISEFGIPSSRGLAHFQPQGLNHGGHSELEQARIDAQLFDEISASGMAGGMVFSWLDEWFKRNWLYYELERPADRRAFWHSMMEAEQNYGILAATAANQPKLEANRERWKSEATVAEKNGLQLKVIADAEYLHLLIQTPLAANQTLELGLDTHPGGGASTTWTQKNRPDFKISLARNQGKLEAVKGYQVYVPSGSGELLHIISNDKAFPGNQNAWTRLQTEPNRRRIGRTGVVYPNQLDEPGILKPGFDPVGSRDATSDYLWTESGVQLRIPWTLLLVTDPSSRSVYDGLAKDKVRVIKDIGLNIKAGTKSLETRWTWSTWDEPKSELRLKPVYGVLQKLWSKPALMPK